MEGTNQRLSEMETEKKKMGEDLTTRTQQVKKLRNFVKQELQSQVNIFSHCHAILECFCKKPTTKKPQKSVNAVSFILFFSLRFVISPYTYPFISSDTFLTHCQKQTYGKTLKFVNTLFKVLLTIATQFSLINSGQFELQSNRLLDRTVA